jgi:dTDP-4-dehydrorhamnose reductase
MENILVTGSKGQLGNSIQALSDNYPDYKFFLTDVDELDITNPEAIRSFVESNQIGCIVNCAGYTAVDKAETDIKRANLINGTAVGYLAKSMHKRGGLLVHISTDYVFGGEHHRPVLENETPNPHSAYATSKLLGEQAAMKPGGKAVVIRTSWLYSEYGHNFAKTMIKYGRERESLNVVFDQVGTPTYAGDLAKTILDLIPKWNELKNPEILHYSNEGVASWYDFAVAIHRIAGINCRVNPIETKDYPLPAARPFYSVMNKEKIKMQYGITIPHWLDSLKVCLSRLE